MTGSARPVVRVWEWTFGAAPAALWPCLADTARFNEAAGLPRYAVEEAAQPDGTVRRFGTARPLGLRLRWEEGVPEWVAERRFAHRRRFETGPIREVATEIELAPSGAGGSRVRYRLSILPRGRAGGLALRLAGLGYFGRILDRRFREAARFAAGAAPRPFETAPPAVAPAVRQRVAAQTRDLVERGYAAAGRLAEHLLTAATTDLERMRPRTLARLWGLPPRPVVEACLAASRAGLLVLRWDLLCPRCRGARLTVASLDELPRGAHCPSCNIDYGRDFSRNVEVTFEPDPGIRQVASGTFCAATPFAAAHVKVQQPVAAGGEIAVAAGLADGDYRARTVEPGGAADFQIVDGRMPAIVLGDSGAELGAAEPPGRLRCRNRGAAPRTLVVEDRAWTRDALTAHEVTTMQAFRDLFADAVLRPGDEVEIRRVALLFTDISGSSALYNRVGDARAYGWVREHYAVLTRAVRAHDGAVVKTIGDAVMAAFCDPAAALAAAVEIQRAIAEFGRGLVGDAAGEAAIRIKLGLHCGPCIAVTLNGRLDYFGRTVNLAARLEGESRGGEIVLSEAMASEPEIADALAGLGDRAETARLKGFAQPVPLRRIAAV